MRTTFPFKQGDVFFCRGNGWLDKTINFFQSKRSKDGDTRCSHTGVVTSNTGDTFETTPWRTGFQNLGVDYAGSDLVVVRWNEMKNFESGIISIASQCNRIYPYWRLLAHALNIQGWVHGKTMECCVLAATFLRNAGFVLNESNLWNYDTETLHDELVNNTQCSVVFEGSQRAQGFIVD